MLNRPLPAPARDIAMLIARVVLGVVLFAHGWQKLIINGISATYGQFEKLGIPLAIVSASFTSFVEFVGGVLIILGALTTTVVALDLVVMVGAAGFVHVTHGIFAADGGWELVGVIVAVELALAAFGPGRYSVDDLLSRRRAREHADLERRKSAPVMQAARVSETFTPAVDARTGVDPVGVGTGAFAAADLASSTAPTGAFAAATPADAAATTGAYVAARAAGAALGGFAADAPAGNGATTGAFAAPVLAATAATSSGFDAADPAENGGATTGAFAAAAPAAGRAAEVPVADSSATVAFAVVPPAAEPEPAPAAQHRAELSPRMASAGVHRTLSERAQAPAPFGVTVQSPLDFTPTTAMPVIQPSVETDTITVATAVPGGLPRRVRAADLPPASAVRPYA
jgi:putative oxidoreductase